MSRRSSSCRACSSRAGRRREAGCPGDRSRLEGGGGRRRSGQGGSASWCRSSRWRCAMACLLAQANVAQAKAAMLNAEVRLRRAEVAFDAGIAARQEVDDARAAYVAAQSSPPPTARLFHRPKSAFTDRAAGAFRRRGGAPFQPFQASRWMAPEAAGGGGAHGGAGAALGAFARDALRVRAKMPAVLRIDGIGDRSFPGTVVAISPVIDPSSGLATSRIRVENPSGALKSGFGGARADHRRGPLSRPWRSRAPRWCRCNRERLRRPPRAARDSRWKKSTASRRCPHAGRAGRGGPRRSRSDPGHRRG